MNKKGITGLAIIFAIAYFMFGMITYQLIKPDIAIQRIDLNCASPTWDGDKITCLILDGVIPLLIITFLSVAGGIISDQSIK